MKVEKIIDDVFEFANTEIVKNNLNVKISRWAIEQAILNRNKGISMRKAAFDYVNGIVQHNTELGNTN